MLAFVGFGFVVGAAGGVTAGDKEIEEDPDS